jgi:hypothetical protein
MGLRGGKTLLLVPGCLNSRRSLILVRYCPVFAVNKLREELVTPYKTTPTMPLWCCYQLSYGPSLLRPGPCPIRRQAST